MNWKKLEFNLASIYLISYTFFILVASEIMKLLEPHNFKTFFDGLWWSIVTATTVGYGDVVPHTEVGKILAIIIIIGGVIEVAAFTAIMTSQLVERKIFSKKGTRC